MKKINIFLAVIPRTLWRSFWITIFVTLAYGVYLSDKDTRGNYLHGYARKYYAEDWTRDACVVMGFSSILIFAIYCKQIRFHLKKGKSAMLTYLIMVYPKEDDNDMNFF